MNVSPRYIEEAVKAFRRWIASVQQQTRRGVGVQGIRLVACSPDGAELVTLASFGVTEPTVYGSKTTLQVSVPIVEKSARQMTIDEHLEGQTEPTSPASMSDEPEPVTGEDQAALTLLAAAPPMGEGQGFLIDDEPSATSLMGDTTLLPTLQSTKPEPTKPAFKVIRGKGGRFQKVPVPDV